MSKRSTSNPSTHPANSCGVEYIGQHFAGKGAMTDLSGDGMKTLGTYSCPYRPAPRAPTIRDHSRRIAERD